MKRLAAIFLNLFLALLLLPHPSFAGPPTPALNSPTAPTAPNFPATQATPDIVGRADPGIFQMLVTFSPVSGVLPMIFMGALGGSLVSATIIMLLLRKKLRSKAGFWFPWLLISTTQWFCALYFILCVGGIFGVLLFIVALDTALLRQVRDSAGSGADPGQKSYWADSLFLSLLGMTITILAGIPFLYLGFI